MQYGWIAGFVVAAGAAMLSLCSVAMAATPESVAEAEQPQTVANVMLRNDSTGYCAYVADLREKVVRSGRCQSQNPSFRWDVVLGAGGFYRIRWAAPGAGVDRCMLPVGGVVHRTNCGNPATARWQIGGGTGAGVSHFIRYVPPAGAAASFLRGNAAGAPLTVNALPLAPPPVQKWKWWVVP
ncbi:hypothetical protein [Polyangium jinanense]|uniref:Ricin B lectin domain-containing protein n=1 Tax=Polyangium jinanense TaxID=2829994 RepID=A0A9X3WWQ4_9BACT|nr:hypothetical protein [Polyangium jinanense]MDC3979632.1 hypothetical protein [Polyangium jinanense]